MSRCAWVVVESSGFLSDGSRYRQCSRQAKEGEFCVAHSRQADKRRLLGLRVNPYGNLEVAHVPDGSGLPRCTCGEKFDYDDELRDHLRKQGEPQ